MSRNTWDAVLASAPLNATAGSVTSRGYQYTPDKKLGTVTEWDAPPILTPFHSAGPEQVDLTGRHFGRLTVIGYMGSGKWCCRCACGQYVQRTKKAVTNPANAETDRCSACRHTAFLARAASGPNARRRAESEKAKKW